MLGRDDREFKQGEIFLVKDELVNIPDTVLDLKGRVYHRRRPVVILYDTPSNANPNSYTVIAATVSHRTDLKRETDLICPKSAKGLKQDSTTDRLKKGSKVDVLARDIEGGDRNKVETAVAIHGLRRDRKSPGRRGKSHKVGAGETRPFTLEIWNSLY